MSCKHFKEDDSDCPDITFCTVHVIIESLQRHIDWWTNIVVAIFFQVWVSDSKSKISNFDNSLAKKDICWFEVSMDDAKFIDSSVTIDDLFKNTNSLFLGDGLAHFDHFGKVAPVTELGDNACVWLHGDDLVEFDDVLDVAEQSKDFHFVVEKGFVDFSLDVFHVDEFEGQGVTLVMRRVPLV